MLQGVLRGGEVAAGQALVRLRGDPRGEGLAPGGGPHLWRALCEHPYECSVTHLLKHERKLHALLGHALHVQEAVEFEVEFPVSFVLLFLTASQSYEGSYSNIN